MNFFLNYIGKKVKLYLQQAVEAPTFSRQSVHSLTISI
jgi:hypothetical protein